MAEVQCSSCAVGEDEYDGPANQEMAHKETEAIQAIRDDICKWLSAITSVQVRGSTFLSCLDNGVLLCGLAERIQERARARGESNIPPEPPKCNTKALPGSFQARDNASNFLEWCRGMGVSEAVLFESSGLVDHRDEKNVVLCLLEVGRVAGRLGLSPPELVRMEREIEELDYNPPSEKTKPSGLSDKVLGILRNCQCSTKSLKVTHCGHGKFIVTGGHIKSSKTLHARLLSDRVMVRVGGGWDTLDHFLLRHDPCRRLCIDLKT